MEGITICNVKAYYLARVTKTLGYCWRINTDHAIEWTQNRILKPEIDPYKYVQLFFDKSAKTIQCRKDCLFNK